MSVDPRAFPVRFSRLKTMGRSPAHFRHALEEERPDTAAMRLGRLVHWLVLGGLPDDEDGAIVVYDGERRGNAWRRFAAENAGADIVTTREMRRAEPIAAAVLADPVAAQFIRGEHEKAIRWRIGDRACSSRLDVLGHHATGGAFVTDLKTTTDASPIGFQRQAWRMSYHAQLAYYVDAARFVGEDVIDAYLVAVETAAPYAVTTHRLSPRLIEEGRRQYRAWFERLLVCEASNDWPSYSTHTIPFDVPEWTEESADDDDDPDDEEEAAA